MNKKPTPRKKSQTVTPAALIDRAIREARRRMKYLDDGVRYVVYERPFRGAETRFFLNVSEDAFRFGTCTTGTLFKQARIARLVAREYSALRQRRLYVAQVTIQISGMRGGGHKKRRVRQ